MDNNPLYQWCEAEFQPTGDQKRRGLNSGIMEELSQCLQLDLGRIHEIEYEDIEIAPVAQEEISRKISSMAIQSHAYGHNPYLRHGQMPCRSFWVEKTEELILYIWAGGESKTLIVPREAWTLRRDIRIH